MGRDRKTFSVVAALAFVAIVAAACSNSSDNSGNSSPPASTAGASAGLGYVILQATPNLQTARIFAAILILTLIAMALFGLVSLLERIFVPWAPKGAGM